MAVTISSRGSIPGRITHVYEFFDARVLGHLWFVAMSDGVAVQLLVPTFRSERAARIFERCVLEHPSGALLSMDGQLELARRIEERLTAGGVGVGASPDSLCGGLRTELR